MLDVINKVVGKLFGSKAESDLKEINPFISEIKELYPQVEKLSNDELRNKTFEFRNKINEHLRETEDELNSLANQVENDPEMEMKLKEEIYTKIDQLKKTRNEKIEEILTELLPE